MRILRVALAVSAALHGGAVAWVSTRPAPEPEREAVVRLEVIEIEPPRAADPPPTEVTLLDDHTVATAAPDASSASHTRQRARDKARISAGAATTTGATGAEASTTTTTAPDQPPSRTKLMTMRPPKLEQGPSAEFWAKFEANTKPLRPKDIAGERLGDEIAAAEGNLNNPRWIANASPEQVHAEREKLAAKRYEKSNAELRPDGAGTKAEHQTFKARFNPDGTVASIDDKANLQRKGLGGSFDVTDALMRSKGIDPYSSYKLEVLDETREERVAIGKRYRTQQLAQSRQHMQKNLDRLWATTTELAARKQGLFELWDDCAETGSAELVTGGTSARAHVLGFIRAKLPAGSGDAYTTDELALFNKRRKSRTTFAPYEAL